MKDSKSFLSSQEREKLAQDLFGDLSDIPVPYKEKPLDKWFGFFILSFCFGVLSFLISIVSTKSFFPEPVLVFFTGVIFTALLWFSKVDEEA